MADTSKIRIRVGQVEVEYEGEHAYLTTGLPKLIESLIELGDGDAGEDDPAADNADDAAPKAKKSAVTDTVAAVAARLDVKTGPDLVMAAAAQLTFVAGHDTFSRKVLLKAMRSATSYYQQSYRSNLSKILKTLLTGRRLTEPSSGMFALTAHERKQLEAKLSA
jgi:hypothetical protein